MQNEIILRKGEIRTVAMSVYRRTGNPVEFSGTPTYQVRKYPFTEDDVVFPQTSPFWRTASVNANKVFQKIDTEDDWAVTGQNFRVYFKVRVITPDDTVQGYLHFKVVD